ncbi:MAG: RluA family pseudouridine synthase [Henriciella sp.]|nr:RluA family pseudouridine synthase [Henriciella sp.]
MRNRPVPVMTDADKAVVRSFVIHEDAAVLAFNKPSGLPVQSRGNKACCLDQLLWAFARSNGKRPRLVHRIDAGTSGLVIAAKTQPAAAFLSSAFEARRVGKRYLALVSGTIPKAATGMVDTPLLKLQQSDRPARSIVSPPGTKKAQTAQTRWTILARAQQYALIEARPVTGRMHQIRAHLAHLGMPILGDPIYGGGEQTAPRLMLHAASLELPHPDIQSLKLEAPVPGDFSALQSQLGLGHPV